LKELLMTTIRTVAERAGVSVMTVSRVLNQPETVTERMRTKVLSAARELDFVPDQRARAMRLGRSGVVGLLTDVMEATPCSVDIVQSVEGALAKHGLSLLIGNSQNRPGGSTAILKSFQASRVEGIVFAATFHREVEPLGAPLSAPGVLVNCFARGSRWPSVIPDEEGGGYAVGVHLLGLGHRQVAYLTLAPGIEATRLRQAGLIRAFREAGVSFPERLVAIGQSHTGAFDRAEAFAAATSLLSDRRPTAVFCGNDEMAMQVYNAAARLGISIPHDLSVVGFDDHQVFSEGLMPALTTVALPYERIGRIAADLLIEQIAGRRSAEIIRVQGPLMQRSSTSQVGSD
jgi:LacI family transcriptional regulator